MNFQSTSCILPDMIVPKIMNYCESIRCNRFAGMDNLLMGTLSVVNRLSYLGCMKHSNVWG